MPLPVVPEVNTKSEIWYKFNIIRSNYDIKKYKKIGVTAGASTPKAIVKEVIDQINNNVNIYKTNKMKLRRTNERYKGKK